MRALLVSSIYPPTIGGPAPHTQQIAREWARRGFTVDVCVPEQEQPVADEPGFSITVMRTTKRRGIIGKIQRNLRFAATLDGLLREKRPEFCVMMVFGGSLAFITALLCRWHRVPAIVKLTGEKAFEAASERDALAGGAPKRDSQSRPGWKDVLLTRLYRAVWATSPFFAERLEKAYGLSADRIFYQPNFIDHSRFETVRHERKPSTGPHTRILTVCRLRPWKGIETCLRAAAGLKDISFQWSFVGSGPEVYATALKELVRQLGLEDRVTFHGEVPPASIHGHYREADLFVLLSDYEPFGIVLLEAMAAGVPIVATRTGGIPSVTDGERAATLIAPGDVAAAASAIRSLLKSSGRRESQVRIGVDRLKSFSVGTGCQKLAEFGRQLSRPSARPPQVLSPNPGNVGAESAWNRLAS